MGCTYGARVNSLWSIWYCAAVVALHVYIVYVGIERYKLYAELHWPPGQTPNVWLIVYGCIHAGVVCLQPVFIACALFKVGNLPSDNEQLGLRPHITLGQTGALDCCTRRLRSLWLHAPPVAQGIHALCALSLLLAQQFMLASLYRVGFIRTSEVWSTELDVFFRRPSLLRAQLPINVSKVYGISHAQLEPAFTNGGIAIRLVPLLVNQHIYGIPLEFVNYLVALIALAIVYPNVFWRASKSFSTVFSMHMCVHAVNAVFAYISMSLLLRVHMTGVRIFMGHVEAPFLLVNHYCLIPTYILAVTFTFMASTCVYGYGYNKFFLSHMSRKHPERLIDKERERSMTRSVIQANAASMLCCEGYGAHIAAIVMLVLMVVAKAPIMYDLMVLYQHQSSPILFACIVADVAFLFWWIIVWLVLTLRRDWPFVTQLTIVELVHLLRAQRLDDDLTAIDETALMLIVNDDAYVTNDVSAKHSIMREAYSTNVLPSAVGGVDVANVQEDGAGYWMGNSQQSNRRPHEEQNTVESGRLLAESTPTPAQYMPPGYQTLDREQEIYAARRQAQNNYSDYGDSQTTAHNFATLQHARLNNTRDMAQYSTVQRHPPPQHSDHHSAVVHNQGGDINHYGQGNYGRPTPPQARVIAVGSNAGGRQTSVQERTYGTYKPPSSVHSSSSHMSSRAGDLPGHGPTFSSFGGASRDTTPTPYNHTVAYPEMQHAESTATLTPALVTHASHGQWQVPAVLDAERNDSANFSLASSESQNTVTRRGQSQANNNLRI